MTAPRWEDVPEAERDYVTRAVLLDERDRVLRARACCPAEDAAHRLAVHDRRIAALDAALARLAEPAQPSACQECGDAILSNGSRYVRKSTGALLCIECAVCAASEPAPAQPTAAERWLAVPADVRRIVLRWVERGQAQAHRDNVDAYHALTELAREAEGGGR